MRFRIGFEMEDRATLHRYWEEILTSHQWSGGRFVPEFERLWSKEVGVGAVAFSSWSGAALSALTYFERDRDEWSTALCPANTFMATPLVTQAAGIDVEFLDCKRTDLCLSANLLELALGTWYQEEPELMPLAVWVTHIGGHIAFDIERIAAICREFGIVLLEDCAHAHGASWNGRKAGTWGDAGIYSFHATKTISTGEGGMLVSRNEDLLAFAREFRDYGKPSYKTGLNYRMSEFTAAIGCVQTKRLPDIVAWKNEYAAKYLDPIHPNRVRFPEGMVSGLYKFIVFDPIENSTGKVYEKPCHRIMRHNVSLPNTDFISRNHWCAPLWFKGNECAL